MGNDTLKTVEQLEGSKRKVGTTADIMLQYLEEAGVRHIFGYPGTPNLELIENARLRGFDLVLGRREGTAGFMAQAYGMLTGLPGVCLSTLGPGSTALVNPVANAYLDRVPMIAISGQASTGREGYFTHQVVDHNRMFAPITKWATRIGPETAGSIMRKALRVAMADRPGPVHITTHSNVLDQVAEDGEVSLPPLRAFRMPVGFSRAGGMEGVESQLQRSRSPMMVAGISALRGEAMAELQTFAETIQCPVIVSPMAKGVFPEDHPLYAGSIDMACNDVVWEFLARADLLICVGFDAVELIKPWKLKIPTIHVDSTPNTDQIYTAETELVGDIGAILGQLSDGFRGEGKWSERDVSRHRDTLVEKYYQGRVQGRLNPTDVVDAAQEAFPADTIVSTDVGSHKLLVGQGWQATKPRSFLMTNGLSSMGFGLPAALTAKLLFPDRPVLGLIGDGGFAMVQSEMQLASELGLGVVIVVFCDESLNRIEIKQQVRGYPSEMTRITSTDLVRLAESMGCEGRRAENRTELDQALAEVGTHPDHPVVIGAQIDPAQYLAQF